MSLIFWAVEEYEKCAALREAEVKDSATFLGTFNLASAYARLGQYDKRRSTLENYLEHNPNNAWAHAALGESYLATGQFAEAQRESDKALLLEPRNASAVRCKGDVALLRGDFAGSEREYLSVLDPAAAAAAQDRREARFRLGVLYLTQGLFEKTRDQMRARIAEGSSNSWLGWVELEVGLPALAVKTFQGRLADPAVATRLSDALYAMSGLGLSYVALQDYASAQKTLDNLKAFPEGLFVKLKNRLSLSLSGALAGKRGDGRTAVADLERAVSTLPHQSNANDEHAHFLNMLAQAYTVAGDLAKARETYEKITTLTTGRMAYGATYARSFYHLGVIAERQGDKARARTQFQKFLEHWKNADKGLDEIADAKKRMAQ